MKLDVSENYDIILKEVYNPVIFETADGEKLCVCMRDSGFEIMYTNGSSKHKYELKDGVLNEVTINIAM